MQMIEVVLSLCFAMLNLVGGVAAAGVKEYSRYDFPPDFIFGASTSAYQVEGAALHDGRTPGICDTYAHQSWYGARDPDVTSDQYHKYKEDVQLMVETGLDAYRFSISWSRLIPYGRGTVNPKGLRYYNNLINELIKHGIEPHVTLFHSDLPQILEDEYEGFISPTIIEDYTAYADVCFSEFGDRVRHWTTFNEANMFIVAGYDGGYAPPSRCSPYIGNCSKGDSTTEPYIAAHNILLAHASAVRLYKDKYQDKQHGIVGFNLLSFHFAPVEDTIENIVAARRAYEFFMGWFMHPLTYGDYPEIMKKNVGIRIPVFSKNESKLVKGSYDFIGINYYSPVMIKDDSKSLSNTPRDFFADMAVKWITSTSMEVIKSMYPNEPWGLEAVLEYYKDVYENPPIFIHENGQVANYSTSTNDPFRIEYLNAHMRSLLNSVRNGSNTRGYFVWSFLDVWEYLFGFNGSFGLYYVDFDDANLARHPKMSQRWYSQFLKGKIVTSGVEYI